MPPAATPAGTACQQRRRPVKHRGWQSLAVPLILLFALSLAQAQTTRKTDAQIRQMMLRESIAKYSGSCPCPYSTDRAGRKCGARSAYSKPGGAAPLCFETDVTPKMVADYRKEHGL